MREEDCTSMDTKPFLSDYYEDGLRADCSQLFGAFKVLTAGGGTVAVAQRQIAEDTAAGILDRLVAVVSYRHGTKVLAVTTEAIKYICRHQTLPIVFVEMLNITQSSTAFVSSIDILYKLIVKGNAVPEFDRKVIRRQFADPVHFKGLLDAIEKVNTSYISDKILSVLDIQLKLLKIVHCVYVKKGSQTQTSLITKQNINTINDIFFLNKTNREITYYLLGLIKVLCRNKQNSPLFCCDNFINSFLTAVQCTGKLAMAVTILKFLSRHSDSVQIMSKSEPLLNYIMNTLLWDKVTNKKHLISTLYRMTYNVETISKYCYWTKLLEFFCQLEKSDDQKCNLLAVKVFTILNRGVAQKKIAITPYELDVNLPESYKILMRKISCTDGDSDEENDEEEDQNNNRKNEDDSDESEDDSEVEEEDFKNEVFVDTKLHSISGELKLQQNKDTF